MISEGLLPSDLPVAIPESAVRLNDLDANDSDWSRAMGHAA